MWRTGSIGAFVEDQIALRNNLQLSVGVRYDWQTYFKSIHDFAPRASIAYSTDDRKMIIRAGAGLAGGETVPIEAVAADTSLEAIKGKVTGEQSGKSLMVRSLSAIGETAAMIVGAPSETAPSARTICCVCDSPIIWAMPATSRLCA